MIYLFVPSKDRGEPYLMIGNSAVKLRKNGAAQCFENLQGADYVIKLLPWPRFIKNRDGSSENLKVRKSRV